MFDLHLVDPDESRAHTDEIQDAKRRAPMRIPAGGDRGLGRLSQLSSRRLKEFRRQEAAYSLHPDPPTDPESVLIAREEEVYCFILRTPEEARGIL